MEYYTDYFEKKWGGLKPFVKLFQTEYGNYLYDPGTNKLLRCKDITYAAIREFQIKNVRTAIDNLLNVFGRDSLIEGLQEIIDTIEGQNILLSNPKEIYFDSLHFSNLESEINDNLGQLILEVTEECNLRCSYCVYDDTVKESRGHGNKRMGLSTAYKAIDYIGTHSSKQEAPAITFYGGGTFESAMNGLKNLIEDYGEKADKRINLSMVYTPPFSSGRLNQIASLWKNFPFMGNMGASITYPHNGSIPRVRIPTKEYLIEDKSLYKWAMSLYFDDYLHKRQPNPLVKSFVDRLLLVVFRRPIFDVPVYSVHLNGCCVPGARKIYVTTDGYISVCERVHNAPPYLGHIDTGINFNLLKRVFVDEYAERSLIRCANCWALRFCGLCYADGFSNHKYDDKRKSLVCESVIKMTEEQLKLYSRLLHVNPEGLNYLADIVVN